MRPIAIVGWLGIIGALLAWQGIGLVRGPEWPTLSDFFRAFMATMPGRFLLFGLWLKMNSQIALADCSSHLVLTTMSFSTLGQNERRDDERRL